MEENPHGTRVFKTRVLLILPSILLSSSSVLLCVDLKTPIVQRSSPPLRLCSSSSDCSSLYSSSSDHSSLCSSSSDLFFFGSVVLQVPGLLFFKSQNRVLEIRDLSSIILPTHQVGIESLILEF